MAHQLVLGVLADRRRDLLACHGRQLVSRPRPVRAQAGLDGAEAGHAGRLAQRREPARAEVDRVQRQAEGGAVLQARALEVGRGRRLGGQRGRVRLDRVVGDADVPRAGGDRGRGRADLGRQAHSSCRARRAPAGACGAAGRSRRCRARRRGAPSGRGCRRRSCSRRAPRRPRSGRRRTGRSTARRAARRRSRRRGPARRPRRPAPPRPRGSPRRAPRPLADHVAGQREQGGGGGALEGGPGGGDHGRTVAGARRRRARSRPWRCRIRRRQSALGLGSWPPAFHSRGC